MTEILDEDLYPMLERVLVVLSDYDAVTQQKLLELATFHHAARMGEHAFFVADSMHKHVTQILKQRPKE